ncbi:hypothetical protein [Nocardia sp. NPDC004604]|uniref:hypothetical protein n=1 Tax=Nocardia sp. NPDC004604 TaxID=3157013 RepID=UPI0033BDE384
MAVLLIIPADPESVVDQARPWLRHDAGTNLARHGTPIIDPGQSLDHPLDDITAASTSIGPPHSGHDRICHALRKTRVGYPGIRLSRDALHGDAPGPIARGITKTVAAVTTSCPNCQARPRLTAPGWRTRYSQPTLSGVLERFARVEHVSRKHRTA